MSWYNYINNIKNWLQPDNQSLKKAIDKSVEDGLFSKEDILHQIKVLRENVESGQIEEWIKRSGISERKNAKGKKILCLHAGNLPLVGFQTALATLLSGADYFGKISRKDPYLLASFLEEIKANNPNQIVEYSTSLTHFRDLNADKVVFAGSNESIPTVKAEIKRLNAAKEDAEFIIRTAKFSIAYIEDWEESTIQELVEAVLRYGGKGCRSVAMVVSKHSMESVKTELEEQIHSFLEKNPQHLKPNARLKYQFAYNNAIGRSQLFVNDFLIQESEEIPELEFTLNWVQGNEEKVRELAEKFGGLVQTVYYNKDSKENSRDLLCFAQRPPLWWKPDGIDIITRLINQK